MASCHPTKPIISSAILAGESEVSLASSMFVHPNKPQLNQQMLTFSPENIVCHDFQRVINHSEGITFQTYQYQYQKNVDNIDVISVKLYSCALILALHHFSLKMHLKFEARKQTDNKIN